MAGKSDDMLVIELRLYSTNARVTSVSVEDKRQSGKAKMGAVHSLWRSSANASWHSTVHSKVMVFSVNQCSGLAIHTKLQHIGDTSSPNPRTSAHPWLTGVPLGDFRRVSGNSLPRDFMPKIEHSFLEKSIFCGLQL